MFDTLSPEEWRAVALSLRVSFWATLLSLPLGIFVAYALARWEFWGKQVLNGLVHLPLILPPVALPADHTPVKAGRIGVLLVNLGSPDAPDVPAVKRFLREFLSDSRVIEIPQILWRPILNLLILNIRPRTTAANYAKVWMDEGSPITVYTKRQAAAMQVRLGDSVMVDWAMRYGTRTIAERLLAPQATKAGAHVEPDNERPTTRRL